MNNFVQIKMIVWINVLKEDFVWKACVYVMVLIMELIVLKKIVVNIKVDHNVLIHVPLDNISIVI